MNIIFLTLFSFLVYASHQALYKLFKHPDDTVAKCVDGSPSALYIHEGQADKILLYFQGGGMCNGIDLASTIQDCYKRSKTNFGSSNHYGATTNLDEFTILSTFKEINPLYSTWTKVYIPYCDGVLHQGSAQAPIPYKQTKLYFRGMNITLAHFEYLNKVYNLYNANKIVISGTSAGAMAALSWSNHLYNKMKNPNGLLVIFDSGQFVSQFPNPFTNSTPGLDYFRAIKKLAFTEVQPPFTQCLQKQTRQNCDRFGILVNYIKAPIFAIQSQYDYYAIKNILLLSCPSGSFPASLQKCNDTQMKVIEDYRRASLNSYTNLTKYTKNGIWAISCSQHGFLYLNMFYNSKNYIVPQATGKSILQVLEGFILGSGPRINIDQVNWPNNQACRGYRMLSTYEE